VGLKKAKGRTTPQVTALSVVIAMGLYSGFRDLAWAAIWAISGTCSWANQNLTGYAFIRQIPVVRGCASHQRCKFWKRTAGEAPVRIR
jgi:hypothetical protein